MENWKLCGLSTKLRRQLIVKLLDVVIIAAVILLGLWLAGAVVETLAGVIGA